MTRSFENLFIGGSWVPAGAAFDDLNPADGAVWARVADGNGGMALRAIESAQAAAKESSRRVKAECQGGIRCVHEHPRPLLVPADLAPADARPDCLRTEQASDRTLREAQRASVVIQDFRLATQARVAQLYL